MLPDEFKDCPVAYQGVRVNVHAVNVPVTSKDADDASSIERDLIVHPGAVAILPVLSDEDNDPTLLLSRNRRYATGETMWEIPAGTLGYEAGDPSQANELPIDAAARELEEETGYRSGKLTELMSFFTAPGFCSEKITAFLAQELTHVGQSLEQDEQITTHPTPLSQAMQMIERGEIRDAKTLAVLLFFDRLHRQKDASR